MKAINEQTCNLNNHLSTAAVIKNDFTSSYPMYKTCGEKTCIDKNWRNINDSDYDKIDPACSHKTPLVPCPGQELLHPPYYIDEPENGMQVDVQALGLGFSNKNSRQKLNIDNCSIFGHAQVNSCRLDTTNQSVINAYDPLRNKIYSDNDKKTILAYDHPEFPLNMQKLFRCCAGKTNENREREECGGYWRPKNGKHNGKQCNTNCTQTILQYCADSNHPERLLTKDSLCNKWATKTDEAGATNLKHVARYLKKVCKHDNKPADDAAYSNVTINDYNDSCACYRPKEFYDIFLNSVRRKLGPAAKTFARRPNPTCILNSCMISSLAPPENGPVLTEINPNVGGECPPINIASCTTTVNATMINTKDPVINVTNNPKCSVKWSGWHPGKSPPKSPENPITKSPENPITKSPENPITKSPENPITKPDKPVEPDTEGDNSLELGGSKIWIFIVVIIILLLFVGFVFVGFVYLKRRRR
jgi:hypothetical protein